MVQGLDDLPLRHLRNVGRYRMDNEINIPSDSALAMGLCRLRCPCYQFSIFGCGGMVSSTSARLSCRINGFFDGVLHILPPPDLSLAPIWAMPRSMPVERSYWIFPDNSCETWYFFELWGSALRNRLGMWRLGAEGPELGAWYWCWWCQCWAILSYTWLL